jgi:hypothetical protein
LGGKGTFLYTETLIKPVRILDQKSNRMDRNKRNKWMFLIFGLIFLLIIIIIGIDMSKRTTFPESKGNLKERITPSE